MPPYEFPDGSSLLTVKFLLCRQHDKLSKMVNASGYREKVPSHIHQDNVAKLAALMQELLSLEEAGQHIEAQASSNQHN